MNKHGTISEMAVANINRGRSVPAGSDGREMPKAAYSASPVIVVEPSSETSGWIAQALDDLSRAYHNLPDPVQAYERIPRLMRHRVRPRDLELLADWLRDFCAAYSKNTEMAD